MNFPPRDEVLTFDTALNGKYQKQGYQARPGVYTDAEGHAVWVAEYQRRRVEGEGHDQAQANVFADIERIWNPPPTPVPVPGGNRDPKGRIRLAGRVFVDDNGPHLATGFSHFCAPRLLRDYPDRFHANMAFGQRHGFTYHRPFVTTGGWPAPDGWEFAGAFMPWALKLLPQVLDIALDRYRLRASLTLFDGYQQFPTFEAQDAYVRQVCAILLPRLHTVQDIQIANEYWATLWRQHPQGVQWLRAHARTVRELLGPNVVLSVSGRESAAGDGTYEEAVAEARALLELDIVNVSVNHDSREVQMIDGPWRHVRQGWKRVLHDSAGRPVEPDASIDDEPMGPFSSIAAEPNVSRMVGKALVDFVSGRCGYTFHPDAGIWSDLLHPAHKRNGMGEHRLIEDHPESNPLGVALKALVARLPPDLPNWGRTRHGLTNPPHPFGPSFVQQSDGLFTQIWPDGHTAHGVVRAYCAVSGNHFVCALTGVKDRIDLRWDHPLEADLIACQTGEIVGQPLLGTMRALSVPQSWDTDLAVIGKFV